MIHFIIIISICCKYLGTFFIKKQFAIGTYVLPLVPTFNTTYSSLISRIFSTELLLFFQACIYNTHIHLLLLFLTWHRIRKRMKMLIASSSSRRRSRPLSLVLQQSLKIMTLMLLMVFLLDTGQCQDTVSKNV